MPARFQKIEQIFLAAVEQQPDQVGAFLDTACDGDRVLRREVEVLLASDERAVRFIEKSAVGLATKIIENQQVDSLIGQTIGHYKISESIGTGGMGEVYLATDIVAGRSAALKLLPLRFTGDAERLKRFQQEEHALVGLNHPNILTVYEIGEDHSIHYIASELIEGETLRQRLTRGPMQLSEAVDVAIQVASALAVAHHAGIVHRDIKPENIMLRPDGYAKVLDFGIAKLAEQEVPLTMPRDEALLLVETNLGSILGTVCYMSPEQTCGGQVDKSTDIWSLGVVLYEMVMGRAPFSGDTPKKVMSSILEKEPLPLTRSVAHAPADLQQIITKALRKDRAQRYRDAHELLQALKRFRHKLEVEAELKHSAAAHSWYRRGALAALVLVAVAALLLAVPFSRQRRVTTSSPPPGKTIAVLPLQNLSDDKENAFFADGVQDELLSNLSKIKDLKVISRTSVMQYKSGTSRNLKEIAQQLGVSNVVEGSVRRSGDHVRVSVQLVDTRTDRHLWAENYDRKVADSVSLQGELATEIARAVGATLSPQEKARVGAKPTNNPAAYDAYLRARAFPRVWAHHLHGDLDGAIRLYQEAVNLDPSFGLAWAYLSIAHSHSYLLGFDSSPARLRAAKDSLDRALVLDPNLPEVHLALGYYRQNVGDYTGALAEFRQAEQGLPNSADVIEAIALVQKILGNWDDAIAELHRAIELDPRNVTASNNLALTYGDLRRFPEALATLDRVLAWDPTNARAFLTKAEIFLSMGDLPAAQPLLAKPDVPAGWRANYALLRRRYGEAVEVLSQALAVEADRGDPDLIIFLAQAQELAGDVSAARATYQKAVQDLQRQLKGITPGSFEEAWRHGLWGLAYAGLGEAASAIAEGQKAMTIRPISKDGWSGPVFEVRMAEIYAKLADADHAIPILQRVLQLPCGFGITPALLRLAPIWDPIRNDPRFQELAAGEMTPLPEKSIAVLPFENASNEPNSEYLSEGISEALINSLSELQQLRVIARPTAFHYKRKDVDPRQVGRELGVAAVLTGKVRQIQDALNVQVDLVDPVTGAEIWGAAYDRKITDLVAVKQAIAQEVTGKLKLKLSSEDQRRLAKRDSTNAEAYQFYLRGRYFWNKRTSDGIKQAIEHFQLSIERDPNFALGYVGLADSYTGLAFYNFAAPNEAMPKAKESAIKALVLDDTLAEAHATLAHILINYDWNSPAAEKEFKRSIELNPEYATAHQWYAVHYLVATGHLEEAVQEMKKALELEPASLVMNTFMGAILYYAGRYDEAIDQCRRTIQMDPNFAVAHWHLGLAYEQEQLLDAATEEFRKAISLSGGSPLMKAALAHAYAKAQKTHEANEILNELNELAKRQYASAYELATIYVALGNNEEAFQLLAKAYAEHSFHLVNLNVSPQFKSVRSDPRFQDLVQRIGLFQ